jgi:hypothetical protein
MADCLGNFWSDVSWGIGHDELLSSIPLHPELLRSRRRTVDTAHLDVHPVRRGVCFAVVDYTNWLLARRFGDLFDHKPTIWFDTNRRMDYSYLVPHRGGEFDNRFRLRLLSIAFDLDHFGFVRFCLGYCDGIIRFYRVDIVHCFIVGNEQY